MWWKRNPRYADKIITSIGICMMLLAFLYNFLKIPSIFVSGITLAGTFFALLDFYQFKHTVREEKEKITELRLKYSDLMRKLNKKNSNANSPNNNLDLKTDRNYEGILIFLAISAIFILPYIPNLNEDIITDVNNQATLLGFGIVVMLIGFKHSYYDILDDRYYLEEKVNQMEDYFNILTEMKEVREIIGKNTNMVKELREVQPNDVENIRDE